MKTARHSRSGFTIIEVLIVLSIAGFILLIIFLVVPTLRRNERNFSRKHDVALVAAAIDEYRSNHGEYPFTAGTADELISGFGKTISSSVEFHNISGSHSYIPPMDTITYEEAHWCNKYGDGDDGNTTDPIAGNDTNHTKYVVWTQLETGGGSPQFYCVDNHS